MTKRMRAVTLGVVLSGALVAVGARAAAGHDDGGKVDVAEYIFHHVSDGFEYELELPGPLYTGHNPKLDLATLFAPLRLELSVGACPVDPHEAGSLGSGCLDLRPTKHVLMMWLAAVLLIGVAVLGAHRDRSRPVPRGTVANLIEMIVVFIRDEIAVKNIGKEEAPRYTPFLLTIFFFILFMNLLGLVPFMATATGNLAITAGLAICTFVLTQVASIRAAGLGGYLAHLTGGVPWPLWPIMIPVEVLGLFTKPFALTVRLFANMLAGHVVIFFLLGLIFILHPGMAALSVPMAMGMYLLELFVAFVQAYVFVLLSALFIGMGVALGHHAHHDGGHSATGHEPKPLHH